MIRIWRLVQSRFQQTAFDGQGALLFGGRWNPKGYRCAYTSMTSALAVLEVLVNAKQVHLKRAFCIIPAVLPDHVRLTRLAVGDMPPGWQRTPGPEVLRQIGKQWLTAKESVGLQVPSPLAPGEMNLVLNPDHEDMRQLVLEEPIPFRFDSRISRWGDLA